MWRTLAPILLWCLWTLRTTAAFSVLLASCVQGEKTFAYLRQRFVLRISCAKNTFAHSNTLPGGFSLEDQGTCLLEGTFHGTPDSHHTLTILLLCLEKHVSWQHRYRRGVWFCCCVSIMNTGFSPFHMLSLKCWEPSGRDPTITEECTTQTWPSCNFSLNFVGGLLWGSILQSFIMRSSPGCTKLGNSSNFRGPTSSIEHPGRELMTRRELKSHFLRLDFLFVWLFAWSK